MHNYLQDGERVTVVAPAAVVSGDLVIVGLMFGAAIASAASGAPVVIRCGGISAFKKTTGLAIAQGAVCYWDAGAASVTNVVAANTKIGVAAASTVNADISITVRLNGSF